MKEIIIRTLSGIIYTGLLITSLLLSPWFFLILISIINIIAATEFATLRKYTPAGKIRLLVFTISAYAFIVFADFYTLQWGTWLSAAIMIFTLFSDRFQIQKDETKTLTDSSKHISLPSIYITLPLLLAILLNVQQTDNYQYLPFVLVIFIFIWVNDTLAYLVGSAIGKHRIYEKISPKKSWEGFAGGLLAVLLTAFFISTIEASLPLYHWVIIGSLVSVFALLGDFYESFIKRKAGVKDSGKIMPGHGGILDRIDSFLFVSPVVFVYLRLVFFNT